MKIITLILFICCFTTLSNAQDAFDLANDFDALVGQTRVEANSNTNIARPSISGFSASQANEYRQALKAAEAYNCNETYKHPAGSCMSFNLAARVIACDYPKIPANNHPLKQRLDNTIKQAINAVDAMGSESNDRAAYCAVGEMGKIRHKKMLADNENSKRVMARARAKSAREAKRAEAQKERKSQNTPSNNGCGYSGGNAIDGSAPCN